MPISFSLFSSSHTVAFSARLLAARISWLWPSLKMNFISPIACGFVFVFCKTICRILWFEKSIKAPYSFENVPIFSDLVTDVTYIHEMKSPTAYSSRWIWGRSSSGSRCIASIIESSGQHSTCFLQSYVDMSPTKSVEQITAFGAFVISSSFLSNVYRPITYLGAKVGSNANSLYRGFLNSLAICRATAVTMYPLAVNVMPTSFSSSAKS